MAGPDESVRLQWTSEATDISHVYVSFTNETGQTLYAYAYPGEDLVINLDPQKTTTGTYRLNYAYVQDVTGIQTQYQGDGRVSTYPSAATPPPTVNLNLDALTFTVEGTAADTKAPGLSSITRTSPEVAGPDESV
ncbi:hypothetical protein, partial [Kocuria rosea]|uniref:hypothetical protein n=1 Tax=Kocuria rosea TaxID=1275 RepID=UPI00232F1FA3